MITGQLTNINNKSMYDDTLYCPKCDAKKQSPKRKKGPPWLPRKRVKSGYTDKTWAAKNEKSRNNKMEENYRG